MHRTVDVGAIRDDSRNTGSNETVAFIVIVKGKVGSDVKFSQRHTSWNGLHESRTLEGLLLHRGCRKPLASRLRVFLTMELNTFTFKVKRSNMSS